MANHLTINTLIPPCKNREVRCYTMRYRAARLVPCGGAFCFGPPLIPPRGGDPALAASAVDQRP